MARSMLRFDLRRGAALAGASVLLAGCAQEPGIVPSTPDNCILICALIRSLSGENDAAALQAAAPTSKKPVRLAALHPQPLSREAKHRPKPPDATPVDAGLRGTREPSLTATSAQPATRVAEPAASPPLSVQLPGSAPIAEVTSRFVPQSAVAP